MITIRSGKFKNKKLLTPDEPAPANAGVRPTSDKIRQAIFNVLMHNDIAPALSGANILDAFAGTGAMGLEALSRGAAHAWFMEKNPAVRKILAENLKMAGDQATLLTADACAPPTAPQPMDFIFLDPPYGKDLLPPAITALHAAGWIGAETLLIIESDATETIALPDGFETLDERKYGRTKILFTKRN